MFDKVRPLRMANAARPVSLPTGRCRKNLEELVFLPYSDGEVRRHMNESKHGLRGRSGEKAEGRIGCPPFALAYSHCSRNIRQDLLFVLPSRRKEIQAALLKVLIL